MDDIEFLEQARVLLLRRENALRKAVFEWDRVRASEDFARTGPSEGKHPEFLRVEALALEYKQALESYEEALARSVRIDERMNAALFRAGCRALHLRSVGDITEARYKWRPVPSFPTGS